MWRFSWRNLMARPLRSLLAIVGLSIPIFGVLGLLSLSQAVRGLVGLTLDQVQGVLVLRENVLSPITSDLPADLGEKLEALPIVAVAAPQIWKLAPTIEGRSLFARSAIGMLSGDTQRDLLEVAVVEGQGIEAYRRMRHAVFRSKMLPPEEGGGRYLDLSDQGKPRIVISTKIAADNPRPDGQPRQVGDHLQIGKRDFEIIGLYETGSIVFDVTILMDIAMARELLRIPPEQVSSYLVEPAQGVSSDEVVLAIDEAFPEVDARSMDDFDLNITKMIGELDVFLFLIVALALLVGVIGIVNTMLMSTVERSIEFGILRANGWRRLDILKLVTLESTYLGILAGVAGSILAVVSARVVNLFLTGGLRVETRPGQLIGGMALAVVMGVLGGLYPAWRAARMTPMDAIRSVGRM